MESRIPVPTDNIYKFYALFGIALFITSCLAFVYVYNTHLEQAYDLAAKSAVLENKVDLTPIENFQQSFYQQQREIANSNRNTYLTFLTIFIAISFFAMWAGFRTWHCKIQPKHDLMLDKQLEKIEVEICILKKELRVKRR